MTTSNHALTGALIALTVKEPVLVIPLAFLSHFVLDVLPHFGVNNPRLSQLAALRRYVTMELFGIIGIITLLASGAYGFNLVLLASLLAISPDFEWLYRFGVFRATGKQPRKTATARFHKKIQWCERSWGFIPEVIYFVAGYILLLRLI